MVKNGHGVSSKNNPNKTPKTKKRLAAKKALRASRSPKKRS
ncbi:MAG: hypothetical protein AAB901_01585 [Patescibacteria group bacterium]